MASAINLLSGHAYHRESSFGDVAAMVYRYDRGTASSSVLLATIAPAMADILFFLPWGALAFLSLDGSGRPRRKVYLATVVLGVAFALALIAWQQWLPTRVTGGVDVLWNAAGCAAGAALAHARKRVRVRFE
jgi:VanZ family protein